MLSIILPVYNESESILECLRKLNVALTGYDHEIIICYDYDEDLTLKVIKENIDDFPSVRFLKNVYGRGAANAIRSGIENSLGDIVITTMADLSDPPDIIPEMVKKIQDGAWVVSASRYIPGGSIEGAPFLKENLSRLAGLSLSFLTGINTKDVTNNFRAYKRELFELIEIESVHGFEIGLELTVKAFRLGLKIDEEPSRWEERAGGESKFQLFKWLPFYLRWYFLGIAPTILYWSVAFLLIPLLFIMAGNSFLIYFLLFLTVVGFFLSRKNGLKEMDALKALLLSNPLLGIIENHIQYLGFIGGSVVFLGMLYSQRGFNKKKVSQSVI
jgi:glycosyltransferase involved in cell wall biosynthesis